ncbi:hypothetical protein PFMG_04567 [Plasmodium falciparum IGH-CR14]|uniref:Uncharacterized protein n=1 Tax=Plasmodium falciparum IGH-CR14 TaxID=580059 RepID=A0A0L1IFF9_PLAFA|nr:hypothetical protein PFMG_04567 [Plasmodium falciparum IGH-CR14]
MCNMVTPLNFIPQFLASWYICISPLRGEPNKTTINIYIYKFRAPKIGIATRLENHIKLLGKVKKGKKYMVKTPGEGFKHLLKKGPKNKIFKNSGGNPLHRDAAVF